MIEWLNSPLTMPTGTFISIILCLLAIIVGVSSNLKHKKTTNLTIEVVDTDCVSNKDTHITGEAGCSKQ